MSSSTHPPRIPRGQPGPLDSGAPFASLPDTPRLTFMALQTDAPVPSGWVGHGSPLLRQVGRLPWPTHPACTPGRCCSPSRLPEGRWAGTGQPGRDGVVGLSPSQWPSGPGPSPASPGDVIPDSRALPRLGVHPDLRVCRKRAQEGKGWRRGQGACPSPLPNGSGLSSVGPSVSQAAGPTSPPPTAHLRVYWAQASALCAWQRCRGNTG